MNTFSPADVTYIAYNLHQAGCLSCFLLTQGMDQPWVHLSCPVWPDYIPSTRGERIVCQRLCLCSMDLFYALTLKNGTKLICIRHSYFFSVLGVGAGKFTFNR